MGVVEKAGGPLDALINKNRKKTKPVPSPAKPEAPAAQFKVDFKALAEIGYFNPQDLGSPLAKELRAVKRRLLRRLGFLRASGERQAFRTPGRQRNIVLVTSSQAGEGKTFCAINLALSLALEDNIETTLIDADMPRPKLRARLNIEQGKGLADCLKSSAPDFRAVMHKASNAPLSVIGEGTQVERSSELLASDACKTLITDIAASNRDGLVIIDAPPALSMTDAVVLARYVDEVVFVVEANNTPEPAVAAALEELMDVNPNVSLVLNRALFASGASSYHSYDYYGRKGSDAENRAGEGN